MHLFTITATRASCTAHLTLVVYIALKIEIRYFKTTTYTTELIIRILFSLSPFTSPRHHFTNIYIELYGRRLFIIDWLSSCVADPGGRAV